MSDDEDQAWAGLTDGRFVAVTIDPVASVKYLRDAQATKEAAALKSRTYLGFIDGQLPWPGKRRRFVETTLLLAGIGPSPYHEVHQSDATKCVPIAPATKSILNRTPIPITGDPLPFENCYLHSICRHSIGITHVNWKNPTQSYAIFSKECPADLSEYSEYSDFFMMLKGDTRRPIMSAEEAAAHELPPASDILYGSESRLGEDTSPLQLPPSPQNPHPLAINDTASVVSLSPSDDSDTRAYGTHPTEEFIATRYFHLVHVTYDLTTMKTPAPPLCFDDEIAAIESIIQRARERFHALQALIDAPLDEEQAGALYKQELQASAPSKRPKVRTRRSRLHRVIDHLCLPFGRTKPPTATSNIVDDPASSVSMPTNQSRRVKIRNFFERSTSAIIRRIGSHRTTPAKSLPTTLSS